MTKLKHNNRKTKTTTARLAKSPKYPANNTLKVPIKAENVQLQLLFDKTPMGVYVIDADFRILAVNPAAKLTFGDIPDLIGRNFNEVIHEIWLRDYADEIVQLFRDTLATGEPYHTPERIEERRDRGVTEYFEWWINRIPLPDGRDGVVCYFRDVSERVLARLALAKSEEKYRTLFNSSSQGFCILEVIQDPTGKVTDFSYKETNIAHDEQTGLSDVLGKNKSEAMPLIESYWLDNLGYVVRTGEPTRLENYNADTGRWYQANYSRLGNPGSRLVGIVFEEITGRKIREANLLFLANVNEELVNLNNIDNTLHTLCRMISEHFDTAVTAFTEINEAAGTIDPLQFWNNGEVGAPRGVIRITDYHSLKVQRMLRSGKPEVVSDVSNLPKAIAKNLKALNVGSYVNMPLLRHGEWRLTLNIVDSKPRDWKDTELVVMGELTARIWNRVERARAEEALKESQNKLLLALEAANMGTFVWYPQDDRTEYDTQLHAILGYSEDTPLSLMESLETLIYVDDRETYARAVAKALDYKGDHKLDLDYRVYHKDGLVRWLHIFGNTVFSEDKHPEAIRMYGMVIDITENKQLEIEHQAQYEIEKRLELLTEQRNALLKVNKIKDEFIALASHQLRTPATAVKQYTSLMLDGFAGPLTSDQKEYMQIAYDSNERQLTVINDLLKTAQIDATSYKLDNKYYNIVAVVQSAVSDMQTAFKMRRQTISFKSSHKNIPVMVDKAEVKLVFVNLLENASKYSYSESEISVAVVKKAESVSITISDTGVGINSDDQQRIFDKFTRIDNDLSDTVTGSGLGLYWVKQIVEKHSGTVRIISQLKKGTTFTVELPL